MLPTWLTVCFCGWPQPVGRRGVWCRLWPPGTAPEAALVFLKGCGGEILQYPPKRKGMEECTWRRGLKPPKLEQSSGGGFPAFISLHTFREINRAVLPGCPGSARRELVFRTACGMWEVLYEEEILSWSFLLPQAQFGGGSHKVIGFQRPKQPWVADMSASTSVVQRSLRRCSRLQVGRPSGPRPALAAKDVISRQLTSRDLELGLIWFRKRMCRLLLLSVMFE